MVAILISACTIGTVLVWYVYGVDDMNKYFMTKLAGEPRMLADGRPRGTRWAGQQLVGPARAVHGHRA